MPKLYYKVCSIYQDKPNRYFSFNCRPFIKDLCLEYIPHEWTCPTIPKSRLFCFRTIQEARFFRINCGNSNYWSNVFTCYVKNPVHIKYIGDPFNNENIMKFIQTRDNKHAVPAPRGTFSASSIMILDKVDI